MATPASSHTPFRGFASTLRRMVGFDVALLRRYPKFTIAVIGILFVPMLYAGIYLASLWDPQSRTHNLPVAVVNADTGVDFQGHHVQLGTQLVEKLTAQPLFDYQPMQDAEAAQAAVRRGDMAFALLIAPDFSQSAVPGAVAGAGKLVVYVSEGNNYNGAGVAKRFAPELARQLNEALNTQRWNAVLDANGNIGKLRDGVGQLQAGAHQLAAATQQAHQGREKLHAASTQLTQGLQKAGNGVRTMEAHLPAANDLQALKDGSRRLASGQKDVTKGLRQLQGGAGQLRDGTSQLEAGAQKLPFGRAQVVDAAQKLGQGASQLHNGLGSAVAGSDKLGEGAQQLQGGVTRLADGMGQLGGGIHQLAAGLPGDAQLKAYAQGSAQLNEGLTHIASGSQRLSSGLDQLAAQLPAGGDSALGAATGAGMAASVQTVVEVAAPVANQGSGYAPHFAPMALWVGATVCTFLLAFRWLPRSLAGLPNLPLVLGKLLLPGLIATLQTGIVTLVLVWGLQMQVRQTGLLAFTLWLAALAFLAMIFALVVIFGDTGRLIAMVLLVLQLAANSATMPIALSSPFFRAVHPFLPMSWAVQAMRVAMFGAFEGAWLHSVALMAGALCASLAAAVLFARWRLVDDARYLPLVEVD
ncbi:MAG: YhgE/Pip domain-containing protein [Brachymonas sp.]|nr:YhgE/Pip domain-containing protein [Brachymonas sp.]